MTQFNAKVIADIADRTPTAGAFFTYAACRERNVRDGISRLAAIRSQMAKEGFHPVPQDLLSMFRELERAGVGELRGDKFKWSVPIRLIGEAGASTPAKVEAAPSPAQKGTKSLVICFDTNHEVSISFNVLTKEEVQFIAEKLLKEIS